MDNGVPYSGMQKRAKAWSKMSRAEKDEQVRKGSLRTGAKRAVKGGKFGAVAEKLVAYIHLRKERMKVDQVGLSWVVMQAEAKAWARHG